MRNQEFAIVDIETTGGNPADGGGITEVAILIHDGFEIIDTFQSLINPERNIPGFITGLTGIDSEMVSQAPTFSALASQIFELLQNRIFVAHNVNFDFTFLQKALLKEGFELRPQKLCTVRLSRKAFPGYKSYSLGRLCEQLNIRIEARHRAYGDAKATAILFTKIFSNKPEIIFEMIKKNNGETFLPPNISKEQFVKLPEETGIYYFHDNHGKVIYIGKALNIKSRFKGHFSGVSQGKAKMDLKQEIYDVSWELTGNEMLAYLLELHEIKRLWPKYNKSQKFISNPWAIVQYEDGLGYLRFQVAKVNSSLPSIRQFESHADAWKYLLDAIKAYNLCPKLSGIQKTKEACYDYMTNQCSGACCGKESADQYNARANLWLSKLHEENATLLIKEKGRSPEEEVAILFDKGMFIGYSFILKEENIKDTKQLLELIPKMKPYPESKYILKSFLPKLRLSNIFLVR